MSWSSLVGYWVNNINVLLTRLADLNIFDIFIGTVIVGVCLVDLLFILIFGYKFRKDE